MVNKKENTTLKLPKALRDDLSGLKYKYHMDELYQVIQLLLNIKDDSAFEKQINLGKENNEEI